MQNDVFYNGGFYFYLLFVETRSSCLNEALSVISSSHGLEPGPERRAQVGRYKKKKKIIIKKKKEKDNVMRLPGLPGSIRRLHCHGWPSAGEKSLKLINTPSHSPNDGQASPCLKFSFHSYSYPHRLFHPMPCTSSSLSYTCTQSTDFRSLLPFLASLGTCFPLSFSIQSWWKQPKFIHHSKHPPTISHPLSANITP